MKGMDRRLEELKQHIPEVEPADAQQILAEGGLLVDVREPDEIAPGLKVPVNGGGAQNVS